MPSITIPACPCFNAVPTGVGCKSASGAPRPEARTEVKESEQRAAAANQLILQSLRYASRIQTAVLPARRELEEVADDHFLIWEPRDIVGGDFFWFQPINDGLRSWSATAPAMAFPAPL